MMKRKLIAAGAAVAVLATGGAGAATAFGGGEDGDSALTGPDANKAITAALKETGGGEATALERDNEKGATYEVEVRKTDGSTVDVRLDFNYRLVAIDSDSEQADTGK